MNIDVYRKEWLRLHSKYENAANVIVKRHIKRILKKIDVNNPQIDKKDILAMYIDIYKKVGLNHGRIITNNIIKEQKSFEFDLFSKLFNDTLLGWLTQNAAVQITSVANTLLGSIMQTIQSAYANNTTNRDLANEIYKTINDPNYYKWQALRIARTEATSASNYATWISGKTSNIVLEKVWVSIPDNRTRHRPDDYYDHRVMDGVKVGYDELFNVQNDLVMYPGDQQRGEPGNIINCRCTIALVAKRDINGRLIYKI